MATPRSRLHATFLPSDRDFLLDNMAGLVSDDSDDDDFDRYLLSDDEPEQAEDGNNSKNTVNII